MDKVFCWVQAITEIEPRPVGVHHSTILTLALGQCCLHQWSTFWCHESNTGSKPRVVDEFISADKVKTQSKLGNKGATVSTRGSLWYLWSVRMANAEAATSHHMYYVCRRVLQSILLHPVTSFKMYSYETMQLPIWEVQFSWDISYQTPNKTKRSISRHR